MFVNVFAFGLKSTNEVVLCVPVMINKQKQAQLNKYVCSSVYGK